MPISPELRTKISHKEQLTKEEYSDLYMLSRRKLEPLADRILAAKIAWEQAETRLAKVKMIAAQCHDYYLELAKEDGTNRNFNEMKEFMKTLSEEQIAAITAKLGSIINRSE